MSEFEVIKDTKICFYDENTAAETSLKAQAGTLIAQLMESIAKVYPEMYAKLVKREGLVKDAAKTLTAGQLPLILTAPTVNPQAYPLNMTGLAQSGTATTGGFVPTTTTAVSTTLPQYTFTTTSGTGWYVIPQI